MKKIFAILAFLIAPAFAQAFCDGLLKCSQAQEVYENHSPHWSKERGVGSITLGACYAGIPEGEHKGRVPDVVPEACIQITFLTEGDLAMWRGYAKGDSLNIDGVTVYLGPVQVSGPQPGIAIHN